MSNKRRKITVLSWRDVKEFKYVYDQLYEEGPEGQRRAVDRLKSWKARSRKLPVAVECTLDFAEVKLDRTAVDEENFRKVCTLAVIRLVNHFTEELQIYGKGKAVHHLAEKINLPKWLVDIRHQGTHGHMPNVSILEGALTFCLKWLQDKFWEPHIQRMEQGIEPHGEMDVKKRERINQLVTKYMDLMGTVSGQGQNGIVHFKLEEVLGPLNKLMKCGTSRNYLADLLSHDGYLVPTLEQESALGIDTEKTEDILQPILAFWSPLLHYFHTFDFGPIVVRCIVDQLAKIAGQSDSSEDTSVTRYLLCWAKHLIKQDLGIQTCGDLETGSPPRKRHRKGAWDSTVKACISKQNQHSLQLLPNLLPLAEDPPIPPERQQKLLQAASIIVQGPNGLTPPPNGLPTPEEIERILDKKTKGAGWANVQTEMVDGDEKNDPDTIDWSRIPLGSLPWQPDDPEFFQLTPPTTFKRKRKISSEDAVD